MTKTHALEALVIAGFVRGLSVRDVEAALTDALDPEAALSKSTVSRVCAEIKEQFEAWQQRRLFVRRWRDSYPLRCAVCSPIATR